MQRWKRKFLFAYFHCNQYNRWWLFYFKFLFSRLSLSYAISYFNSEYATQWCESFSVICCTFILIIYLFFCCCCTRFIVFIYHANCRLHDEWTKKKTQNFQKQKKQTEKYAERERQMKYKFNNSIEHCSRTAARSNVRLMRTHQIEYIINSGQSLYMVQLFIDIFFYCWLVGYVAWCDFAFQANGIHYHCTKRKVGCLLYHLPSS